MIRVLLKAQAKIAKHTMETNKAGTNVGYAIAAIVIVGALLLFANIITSLPATYNTAWLQLLFSYGFLIMLAVVLLMGIPQVFKHLYAAKDLTLLFTLPIKARDIYWVKFIQSFIGIPAALFVFTSFLGLLYGINVGASWFFYPALPLIVLSYLGLGLALAYFINMGLVHIIPAKRANELMTVMSAVSGLFVYGMFQLPKLVFNGEDFSSLQPELIPQLPGWLPMNWAASALTKALEGSVSFLIPLLLLLICAAGLSLAASLLVEKGFRSGWIQLNEGQARKKKAGKEKTTLPVRSVVTEIGLKEWRYMKRDVREWLIFMPFVFFFIFVGAGYINSGGGITGIRELDPMLSWAVVQVLGLLLFAFFNGSLAASFVAREGPSSRILHVLPITGRQTAVGKLWISWLIPLILIFVIETGAGIALGWTLWQFAAALLINALVSFGLSAMGIWFGTIGGKYNPVNPQNRVQFFPSIAMLILSYVYVFVTLVPVVLITIPTSYNEWAETLSNSTTGFIGFVAAAAARLLEWKMMNTAGMMAAGAAVFLLLTAGCTLLFVSLAAAKIEKGLQIKGSDQE